WHSTREDKDLRIEEAIIRTEQFFQRMGLATQLSAYGLDERCIEAVCANLKAIGRTALGEQQDIDLAQVAAILARAL
ncbi:MAG: NADH-dependent alcohol dehydrogenase, partial [Aeromonas sp.]